MNTTELAEKLKIQRMAISLRESQTKPSSSMRKMRIELRQNDHNVNEFLTQNRESQATVGIEKTD